MTLSPRGNGEIHVNKRYIGKIGGVRINQQLKYSTQVKNRESLNFVFPFSQFCNHGRSLFFPMVASIVVTGMLIFLIDQ